MGTLTVANSAFTINVPDVFAVPIIMAGYSVDDAFDTENLAPSEALMGVDGNLSAGYTPQMVKLKFMLQADSPSTIFMDQWYAALVAAKETYFASATILAPGPGKLWTFTKGTLTGIVPTAPGKKIFQPQQYEVTFQSVTASPIPSV